MESLPVIGLPPSMMPRLPLSLGIESASGIVVWTLASLVRPAQPQRARLLVEVAPFEIERARSGRHLATMVGERLLEDHALALFDEDPQGHAGAVEARGA